MVRKVEASGTASGQLHLSGLPWPEEPDRRTSPPGRQILPAALAKLDRFDAVIDDIGYVQQSREEMAVLFTFLAERYEKKSVVITSNLVFCQWDQIFKAFGTDRWGAALPLRSLHPLQATVSATPI